MGAISVTETTSAGAIGWHKRLFPRLPFLNPRKKSLIFGKRSKEMRRAWWLMKKVSAIFTSWTGSGDVTPWIDRIVATKAMLDGGTLTDTTMGTADAILDDGDGTAHLNPTEDMRSAFEDKLVPFGWATRWGSGEVLPMELDPSIFPGRLPSISPRPLERFSDLFYLVFDNETMLPISSDIEQQGANLIGLAFFPIGMNHAGGTNHVGSTTYLRGSGTCTEIRYRFVGTEAGHAFDKGVTISDPEDFYVDHVTIFPEASGDVPCYGYFFTPAVLKADQDETTFYEGDVISNIEVDFEFRFGANTYTVTYSYEDWGVLEAHDLIADHDGAET